MSSALAIPRKDARLAATVAVPAAVIAGMFTTFCLMGHMIPGVSEVLWFSSSKAPTFASRVALVVPMLAVACYVVPCWCTVVVALGDSAKRAALLATATPASDWSKIASKLATLASVAMAACAALLIAALAGADDSTPMLNARHVWFAQAGPVLAVTGVLSGLAAASCVQRVVPALIYATALPMVGIAVGSAAAAAFVSPWVLDSGSHAQGDWSPRDFMYFQPRANAAWIASIVAIGIIVLPLAVRSLPLLAGRAPRKWPLRTAFGATAGAVLASAAISLTVNATDSDLQRNRRNSALEMRERAAAADLTGEQLLGAIAQPFVGHDFYSGVSVGILPWQSINFYDRTIFTDPQPDEAGRIRHEAMRREVDNRLSRRDATSREGMRAELRKAAMDRRLGILLRLQFANWGNDGRLPRILAPMLLNSESEEEEAAITAILATCGATGSAAAWAGPTDWPGTVGAARQALRRFIADERMYAEWGMFSEADRTKFRHALERLGRPLPRIADQIERRRELNAHANKAYHERFDELCRALRNGVPDTNAPDGGSK